MAFIKTSFFAQHRIFIGVILLTASLVVSIMFSPASKAAFSDLGTSYPDDSYRLMLPNGNPGSADSSSSNSCYISSSVHGDCTAVYPPYPSGFGGTDASHQYVTLSTGNIDDSQRDTDYPGADSTFFSIISEAKATKSLSLSMVSRAIGTLGCKDYSLELTYINPRVAPPAGGYPTQTVVPTVQPDNTCQKTYTGLSFPAASFANYIENNKDTGYWKGIIKVRIIKAVSGNRQASFHINTGNAKLGLAGTDTKTVEGYRPLPSPGVNWINTYPTNGADDHKVVYSFRPPCSAKPGDQFSIGWDDLDYNSSFQFTQPTVRLVRHGLNPADNRQLVQAYTAFPGDTARFSTITMNSSMFDGGGNPYSFSMEFSNIRGGNGISFLMPFDSTNAKIACTSKQPTLWKLDPGTTVRTQIGAYTPQFGSPTTNAQRLANVNRAKTAFSQARFKHYLNEIDGQRAAQAGEHRWTVQYQIRRGDGSVWYGAYSKVAPLNSLTTTVPAGGTGVVLVDNSQPNVNSDEMKILFRNLDDTAYRNPNRGDGNPATLDGDQYCERVNNNTGSNVNGVVVNDPSTWKCVELSGTPPVVCEPWAVAASNSVTGEGDPNDAWVGHNYSYNYDFWKTGPADNTKPINFYHNTAVDPPTHSQTLGEWRPRYGVTIDASMGGQTLIDQMAYTPTTSAGINNCDVFGANNLVNNIIVPYYYHLKPTSPPLPDRTDQGNVLSQTLTVDLPARDDQGDLSGEAGSDNEYNGRYHTFSAATSWRIIEFRTSDINDAKNKIPKNRSGGSGNCAEMASFGIAGFSGCNDALPGAASGTDTFAIGSNLRSNGTTVEMKYDRPAQLDPVGTIICYVGAVGRMSHNPSPVWRYSNVSCTTVVKSPKVQFLNGDLTVGRHRRTEGGSPCANPLTAASIQASGAPSAVSLLSPPPPATNVYGSWVEYGAFAPGTIRGFGTAAYAQTALNNEKKLMFSNTVPNGGSYNFAEECLSNPFDMVKEPGEVTYIDAQAENLKLNEFFATAPNNTPLSDKTGYVANNAAGTNPKNIKITASPPSFDDNFGAFRGRDIILYAKKGTGTCADGGNITIETDINVNLIDHNYGDIKEIPRIILLADCKIIINDNVKRVDAWLIAKDAVETCSAITGMKFQDGTVTQNDCKERLFVNGPVQANRLLLWRTRGGDLTTPESAESAELFNLRPDQLLATYATGTGSGTPTTVYQTDLPPRY